MLHPLFLACAQVILSCSPSQARNKRRFYHLLSAERVAYKRARRCVEDCLPRRHPDACSTLIEHFSREYMAVTILLICRNPRIVREQFKRSVCDAKLVISNF